MKAPTCPEHGNLMLDMARGRLADADALEAELVRQTCPDCAEWWNTTFSDRATAEVDGAVAAAFAGFTPASGHRRVWLAIAAAVVLAVGLASTTVLWRGGGVEPRVAEQAPAADTVLSTWDFEDGELSSAASTTAPTPGDRGEAGEAVFVNDLESGDLGAWTVHS